MKLTLDHTSIHLVGAIGENQSIDMPQNQIVAILGENKDVGGSNGSSKSTFTYASPVSLFGAKAVGKTNKELKNNKIKGTPRIVCKYTLDGKPLIVDRTIGGELKVTFDNKEIKGSSAEVQASLEQILKMNEDQFLQFSYKGQKTTEHFLLMKDDQKKEFLSSFFDTKDIDKMKEQSNLKLASLKKDKEKGSGALSILEKQYTEICEKFVQFTDGSKVLIESKKQDLAANILLKKSSDEQLGLLQAISEEAILSVDSAYQKQLEDHTQLKSAAATSIIDYQHAVGEKNKELLALKTPQEDSVGLGLSSEILNLQEERKKIKVPDELTQELNTCNELINEQKNGIKLIGPKQLELASATQQVTLNEGIIKDIDSKPCPTCNRQFDDVHKDQQKSQFLNKIKEYNAIADCKRNELNLLKEQFSQETLELLIARQSEINIEISTYNTKAYADIDANIAKLKSDLTNHQMKLKHDLDMKISEVNTQITAMNNKSKEIYQELEQSELKLTMQKIQALDVHKKALQEAKDLNNNLSIKVSTAENEIKNINLSLAKIEEDVQNGEKALNEAKEKQLTIEEELIVEEHANFILSKNGFVGHLFDTILDDLNTEINTNLKLVPVTSKFVLNFSSDKTAKTTGEVSKAISYELTENGLESGLGMTSGAEELVILLAVDEAIETILSRRLGINIGWKFLDEQLFWVDGNSKEYVFEFYRQKSKDKTYYIIDHASEFNAAIDCVIKIVKENDISRIMHG